MAKQLIPQLITRSCDIGSPDQRRALYDFCTEQFPEINVLVNNAGIQREIDFRKGEAAYLNGDNETLINLEAIFHLSALFIPHFMRQKESAIINVSSGLGIVPLVIVPVYSATKAALHSFTLSLRKQLASTSIRVFEVIPPIVETDLDRGARDKRGQTDKGISAEKVALETMQGLSRDKLEIPIGIVKVLRIGSRISPKLFFKIINKHSPV